MSNPNSTGQDSRCPTLHLPSRSISEHPVDLRALEYITKVDENLICPICQVALIDPVTTSCDHTFCSDCLNQAYESSETCPIDRLPLKLPDDIARTHKLIRNQLDGLQVRCPVRGYRTKEEGCETILARSMVQNHVEKYCSSALVPCPEPSCQEKIVRKDSGKGCLHFRTSCPDCGQLFMARDLDWHRESYCQNRDTHCEKCSESIIRFHQDEHRIICPEELDTCQWKYIGCSHQSKRKDLHLHASKCDYHIAGPIMQTLQSEIEGLRTEVASLSARDKIRERRIKFLETERLNSQSAEIPDISSLNMLEQSASSEYAPHDTRDQYLLSLLESQESKVDQISAGMTDLEAKQTMMLFNETIPIKESLAELRSAQGVLGMHVRWLMNFRMQERRPGSGAVGSPNNGPKAGGPSSGEASGPGMQPSRRLSDSLRENITKL